jgi:hypothetical protein
VTKVDKNGNATVLGSNLASPPCNIGPRSTPNYAALAQAAVHSLPSGEKVFAGQRLEGFYVDLGSVFDLLDLRPFQNLHLIPSPAAPGVDASDDVNVHTMAIQVPKTHLTRDGSNPTNPNDPRSLIGVYASASRRKAKMLEGNGKFVETGPFVQVSRQAAPLFNEVMVPLGEKDLWNALDPRQDAQFLDDTQHPEVAHLLTILYPGVFPHLAAYSKPRADMVAIFLTGIPAGIISGFQNFTGKTLADLLRLNMAIPPAKNPSLLGLIGGDLAGFPNGRRVFDDVFTIELRALAGVTIPLVDKTFKPDAAASVVSDFETSEFNSGEVPGTNRYISSFPYLGVPKSGFESPTD